MEPYLPELVEERREHRPYGWAGRRMGESYEDGWPINASSNCAHVLTLVVKSGAGTLFGFTAYNSSGSTVYIQLFDQQGGTPLAANLVGTPYPCLAETLVGVSWNDTGRVFQRGIVIASSSADNTYTATSAVCSFDAQYE